LYNEKKTKIKVAKWGTPEKFKKDQCQTKVEDNKMKNNNHCD
jgi:hypothetical protein